MCWHPCSNCDVELADCGRTRAVNAKERNVLRTLRHQAEASGHRRYSRQAARRTALEETHSIMEFFPAIASMAGLSTTPHLLFKTIGSEMLHVRALPTTSASS